MPGNEPASPCVSVCALDENDLCVGCLRSGDEISRWGSMTSCEKMSVLKKVAQRETASASTIHIRTS
jgi:predicted Fe-S protein YdhL (DUF1289 family)